MVVREKEDEAEMVTEAGKAHAGTDLTLRAEVASADFRVIKIEPSTVTVNAAKNLKRW